MKYGGRVCAISYVEDSEEATRRLLRGEHQHQCAVCSKWYWAAHKAEHVFDDVRPHDPVPTGVEVNHFGHLVQARRWKQPCIDCAAAQADWDEQQARAARMVDDFVAYSAGEQL